MRAVELAAAVEVTAAAPRLLRHQAAESPLLFFHVRSSRRRHLLQHFTLAADRLLVDQSITEKKQRVHLARREESEETAGRQVQRDLRPVEAVSQQQVESHVQAVEFSEQRHFRAMNALGLVVCFVARIALLVFILHRAAFVVERRVVLGAEARKRAQIGVGEGAVEGRVEVVGLGGRVAAAARLGHAYPELFRVECDVLDLDAVVGVRGQQNCLLVALLRVILPRRVSARLVLIFDTAQLTRRLVNRCFQRKTKLTEPPLLLTRSRRRSLRERTRIALPCR